MILILQIAAGIVLGFLILQSMPWILRVMRRLWRIALILGVIAGVIVFGFLLESAGKDVAAIIGAIAVAVVVGLAVQYSARGLGYLYVSQRGRIATSTRWINLFRMIGVHPSWHTAALPRAELATKMGDAMFMGLWKFLLAYFLMSLAVFLVLVLAIGAAPFDEAKPTTAAAVWIISALTPGVVVFLWISRRPRDRAPRPPEGVQ